MSTRVRKLYFLTALLASTLVACNAPDTMIPPIGGGLQGTKPTPQASLSVERSKVAVKMGSDNRVRVRAFTATGSKTPVLITGGDTCVTATLTSLPDTGDEINLVSLGAACTAEITINAPGLSQTETLQVTVYDPMSLDIGDGLTIKYTNSYTQVWTDRGTGARRDGAFWKPQPEAGYHVLGTVITDSYTAPQYATIVASDTRNVGALAAPTDYQLVWNDSGSGAKADGSVWQPLCASGYVALGVMVNTSHNKPALDAMRCVASRYTTRGSMGERTYIDQGSGARKDLGAWKIVGPAKSLNDDTRVPLPINASQACPAYTARPSGCNDGSAVYVLLTPLTNLEQADNTEDFVFLTSARGLVKDFPQFYASVRVPFTLLPITSDPRETDFNVRSSPFYTLAHAKVYATVQNGAIDNTQGSKDVTKVVTFSTGFAKENVSQFSQKVGLEVGVEGGVSFLGTGTKVSSKLSGELGWSQGQSYSFSTGVTDSTTFTIPAYTFAEIVQVTTQFQLSDALGNPVDVFPGDITLGGALIGKSSVIKYLEYNPE